MQYALVISNSRVPLAPCHPARARILLKRGKAAVHRLAPFTIRLKHEPVDPVTVVLEVKVDPGSKVTGIALIQHNPKRSTTVYGINLYHRGASIKDSLTKRSAIRRSRRHRKTRYRTPRFLNRTRKSGWLAPSIKHRLLTTITWISRLQTFSYVTRLSVELVKFDTQLLSNPDIHGTQYQQGKLFNTHMREYLLHKYNHQCQYCHGTSKDPVLEWDHVVPRSKGGSNSVKNATLSCRRCNQLKGNTDATRFLDDVKTGKLKVHGTYRDSLLKYTPNVIKNKVPSLKDAAVVNSIRNALGKEYQDTIHFEYHESYKTKYNRTRLHYPKDHWIDAAVLGTTDIYIPSKLKPLLVHATGNGNRQMTRVDRYGFPRTSAKTLERVHGFGTGDIVRITHPVYGTHVGRVAIRSKGTFTFTSTNKSTGLLIKRDIYYKYFTLLQRNDGYQYGKKPINKIIYATIDEALEKTKDLGYDVLVYQRVSNTVIVTLDNSNN